MKVMGKRKLKSDKMYEKLKFSYSFPKRFLDICKRLRLSLFGYTTKWVRPLLFGFTTKRVRLLLFGYTTKRVRLSLFEYKTKWVRLLLFGYAAKRVRLVPLKLVRSRPVRAEKESVTPLLFGKVNGYVRYYSGTPLTTRVHN